MNEGGLEIANAKYPGFDLHVDVDLELVEWNPAVLEREEYAFMSCNLETRAEQYVGTCVKPEDVTTPLLTNPGTGASEVYLQQAAVPAPVRRHLLLQRGSDGFVRSNPI